MSVTQAKILHDASVVLATLKKGNAACNQKQIRKDTGLSACYVSWALEYLVSHGKVIQSNRTEGRGRTIKYYAAAGDEKPASSVMVK